MPFVAGAAVDRSGHASGVPNETWAVSVGHLEVADLSRSLLGRLRRNGINTLVIDPDGIATRKLNRVRQDGERLGFTVLTPISSPRLGLYGPRGAAAAICKAEKARHPGRLCSVAASLATARRLAQEPNVDVVVAVVRGPRDVRYLRGASTGARILAVANFGKPIDKAAWKYGVQTAHRDSSVDLAIAPAAFGGKELDWYFRLLQASLRDVQPTLYVSPVGSDAGPCTRAAPCAGFDRAYRQAKPGDTVEVGCGTYSSQAIMRDRKKDGASEYVKFVAPSECTPSVGARTELAGDYHGIEATILVTSTRGFAVGGTNSIAVGGGWTVQCSGKTAAAFTGCGSERGRSPDRTEGDYFRPGAEVEQSGSLRVTGARWVSFDGIDADGMSAVSDSGGNQPQHVRFLNAAALGCFVEGGNHILFKNIVFGPARGGNPACFVNPYGPEGRTGPFDLIFDGDTFTEINNTACIDFRNNDCHDEAIFLGYANGLTIKNSRFFKNSTYSLMVTRVPPVGDSSRYYAQNVMIQNNFFGRAMCKESSASTITRFPCGGAMASIHFNSAMHGPRVLRNWTVEYNTFAVSSHVSLDPAPPTANLIWRANYGVANLGCDSHWTFSHNVFTGRACGRTDTGSASFSVRELGTNDLHASSPGIVAGKGDPAHCPPGDIDGKARPRAPRKCAAGANEVAKG
jgi:hypothetical protein